MSPKLGRRKTKHQGAMGKPKCQQVIKTGRVRKDEPVFNYQLPLHPREATPKHPREV